MFEVSTMNRYIFLTNIPTPYRTSFYNELNKLDFNFEVYYMRKTEGDRNWDVDLSKLKHRFYIDKGLYKMFGRIHVHFNPKLLMKMIRAKGAEFIIGAGWNDLDVLVLVTLKRLGIIKNRFHFWTEANYLTLGATNDNVLKKWVRKYVYNSTKGAQLSSGKMTELTLDKWGVKTNAFIPLPNTIEEEKFQMNAGEEARRYENTVPVFFLPIRLHEQVKGFMNFFSAIGNDNIRKGLFLIAGDGPDKKEFENFITAHNVSDHIRLLGHCNTEKLVELYKKANVFVLPSYTDASPLTLIEALKMKMPVLVSERCGNHFEAVQEKENGYLLDPYNRASIKTAYESLLARRKEWQQMGTLSGSIYEKEFNKNMVIRNFAEQLKAFSNR